MNIIYTKNDGSVAIIYPTSEALSLITLDQIAKRAVPNGVPYWIVDPSAIPTDRTFRDAWELDETALGKPHGFGVQND